MKEIVSILNKRKVFLLSIILIFCIGLLTYCTINAIADGKFFLFHEDAVINYCSAKLYAETNSVQAEGCIEENVSRIGKMNWYGPGYHVMYGTAVKIFGDHSTLFIWLHVVFACGILALISLFPLSWETRIFIATAVILTEQFSVYIFTYFPETPVLFLSTVLTLLLLQIYQTQIHRRRVAFIVIFILATLIFTLVRTTFIFWLAALLPLAHNWRSFILYAMIFGGGVILSLLYMKFFIAPPLTASMHKIDYLYEFKILDFLYRSARTLARNALEFFSAPSAGNYLMLGYVLLSFIVYVRTRNRLALSSLLISVCLLGTLFAYYNVNPFFFVKQTDMLVPVLFTGIAAASAGLWRYVLLGAVLVAYPMTFKKIQESISIGRHGYEHYSSHAGFVKALAEIPDFIQTESTNILYCYNEYSYGNSTEALLPFATRGKNPILYTTNIVDPTDAPEEKFKLHHRLKIDYILSRDPLSWPSLQEVHSTEYYHLYKLPDGE